MIEINLGDFDAVIFDMDGTMIDNMFYHKRAWMEFTGNHGIYPSEKEFKEKFSGLKNDKILEGIFNKKLTEKEVASHAEKKEQLYRELYAPHIQEVKGLTEILKTLKSHDKKVAVATTAPKKNRDFGLEALRMTDTFSVVLGEEDVTHSKPNPDIYLDAAKRLGVAPDRCLVFEDSPPGVTAGKAAGMKVIGLLTTHSEEELKDADYQIHDFTGIKFQ